MSDREMLELAAKAAGYVLQETEDGYECNFDDSRIWNPLTDDGDALRLAVKLQMCVGIIPSNIKDGYATVTLAPANPVEIGETHNGDPLAATRRAIVRAAAEIGRQIT